MNGANVHGKTQHTRINYIYNKRCRTHPSRCQEDFSSLVGMFPAPRKFPRQNCHHCHVHETASTNRMRNRNGSRPIVTLLGWFFRVFPYFLGMKIQQKPSGKAQELFFFRVHQPPCLPGMVRACAARVSHFLQRLQRR